MHLISTGLTLLTVYVAWRWRSDAKGSGHHRNVQVAIEPQSMDTCAYCTVGWRTDSRFAVIGDDSGKNEHDRALSVGSRKRQQDVLKFYMMTAYISSLASEQLHILPQRDRLVYNPLESRLLLIGTFAPVSRTFASASTKYAYGLRVCFLACGARNRMTYAY